MRRAVQTEGTARAKALRRECGWRVGRAARRSVWPERRVRGGEVEMRSRGVVGRGRSCKDFGLYCECAKEGT